MKTICLIGAFLWATGILKGQNLEFTNNNNQALYPKFVVQNGKTTLTIRTMMVMTQTWNQVPVHFDNSDGRSRYKMIVTQELGNTTVTYEIFWFHIRSTGKYHGHIKSRSVSKSGGAPVERSESFTGKLI